MSEPILIERDKGIAKVFMNRPEAYNAFDQEFLEALAKHMVLLAVDDGINGIVITGKGKAFCAGGDLSWMTGHPSGPSAALHQLAAYFHLCVLEIRRMAKPVIAAINGIAAGGGFSLALACDFRVMGESAIMRQAYTSNGLSIDGGGTFVLPKIVGTAKAMEIAAFDEPISSETALSLGLVTRVAKDNEVMGDAFKMASDLSKVSLHSYGCSKRLINNSFDTPLETQLEQERLALETCGNHPDGQEGIKAFREKRKPSF